MEGTSLHEKQINNQFLELSRTLKAVISIIKMNYNNLKYLINQLSEEFDLFGIPQINSDLEPQLIIEKLVDGTFEMISIHRKLLQQFNNVQLTQPNLLKETEILKKEKLEYIELLKDKDQLFKSLEQQFKRANNNVENLEYEKRRLNKNIEMLKKKLIRIDDEYKHKLSSLDNDFHNFREKSKQEIGKYMNKDYTAVEIINKLKKKEDIYKDTIKKLQNNNHLLVEELLNIKSDVLENLAKNISIT